MDKRTDSGVSPVIATFLLLALSVVMITLVTISVMGIMGSYTPVYERSVGFTIDVNASNDSALITPVSGTDLPFLQSYDVYTDNGHWYSPSPGGVTVDKFNSTVTFINIVGHFPEYVDALVFSGKVAVEGGVIVVVPVGSPYYVVGSEPYGNISELIESINNWKPGVVAPLGSGDGFELLGDLVIADQPLVITAALQEDAGGTFVIKDSGGSLQRAPGYSDSPILVFESSGGLHIISGTLELNGMGYDAGSPLLEINSSAEFELNGVLILKNNVNLYGIMPGGGLYNKGIIVFGGTGEIIILNNTAPLGGGIYNTGTLQLNNNKISITQNTAQKGGGIYNAGGTVTLTKVGDISDNSAPTGNGKSYYAVFGSSSPGFTGLITTGTGDKYRDTDI